MLPAVIPIFPLPNVVLFPEVFLPLHVFESRYRDMVADAEGGHRLIGMVLLRPGWEASYAGTPPVYETGCAGVMTHVETLEDGRYNILLRGVEKFRIVAERPTRQDGGETHYRQAEIAGLRASPAPADAAAVADARRRLETLLTDELSQLRVRHMPNEDFVNALAQHLQFEPVEKQALLEHEGLLARARSLIELVEMKRFERQRPDAGGRPH